MQLRQLRLLSRAHGNFFFAPFHPGRSWKLAATGYLSLAGVLFLPLPLVYVAALPFVTAPGWAKGAVSGVAVVMTLLFALLFYVCSRLNFAFFDLLLKRGQFVAPAWRFCRSAARRWSLIIWSYGLVAIAVIALPLIAYIRSLLSLFERVFRNPDRPLDVSFIDAILTGYFILGA